MYLFFRIKDSETKEQLFAIHMQCASDKFISNDELSTDFISVQFLTITFKDQSNTLLLINFYSYDLFAGKLFVNLLWDWKDKTYTWL